MGKQAAAAALIHSQTIGSHPEVAQSLHHLSELELLDEDTAVVHFCGRGNQMQALKPVRTYVRQGLGEMHAWCTCGLAGTQHPCPHAVAAMIALLADARRIDPSESLYHLRSILLEEAALWIKGQDAQTSARVASFGIDVLRGAYQQLRWADPDLRKVARSHDEYLGSQAIHQHEAHVVGRRTRRIRA